MCINTETITYVDKLICLCGDSTQHVNIYSGVVVAPPQGILTKMFLLPTKVSGWEVVGPSQGVEEGGGFI